MSWRQACFPKTYRLFCASLTVTRFMQEAATIDQQLASVALGQFKSCVRTTLLLCDGYECQETDGAFVVAFNSPRAALEWALTLQLALLRCAVHLFAQPNFNQHKF